MKNQNLKFQIKLSPIKSDQKSPDFATVDIEGMNWTKFICLGHYDGINYKEFKKLDDYINWLGKTETPKTIVAHFGGKYDFMFLIKAMLKNRTCKVGNIIPRGSSILYFTVTINSIDYTFRDSAALLPFSLASIAENFGTDIKKGSWDHTQTKGYTKELGEYLKADCISLHQSIKKLHEWPLIKKAGPAWTMASQAMRVFRTYLKEDMPALGKYHSDFCRKAYLGGRTEIFKPYCKTGPLYEYDVNSLYPFVMASHFYPAGRSYGTRDFESDELGIYHAEVVCPKDLHIPVLGIIHDGKYIFPNGKFQGRWTSKELQYAKTHNYKVKIIEGISFESKAMLFTDFIKDLYNIRKTSPKNSVSDILAKLLMNSSYGRYGMNLNKENIGFDLKEGVKEFQILKLGKQKIELYKEPVVLNSFTHVAIATFVTSYARIHMHKLMYEAGEHLYYTDTDSLFTTKELATGRELGQLKHEATYDSAVFLLPKTYIAKNKEKTKRAMKGFASRKIQNFDMFDFKNALEGDLRKFKIENEPRFATFKQALKQKKIVTLTKASTKQLKAKYNKRIIFKQDGELKTKPITIGELNAN